MLKNIGIIGAGFSGLSSSYYLSKKGDRVSVFEIMDEPGGRAIGFRDRGWKWTLEEHYHHLFTSDLAIQKLAQSVGVEILFKRPKTSTLIGNKIYQLDSPISLMKFDKISFIDRIRTGIVIFYLKITPFWKSLEKITAYNFLIKFMGEKSWNIIWKPLFVKKFGTHYSKVSMAWFWGRIHKRSMSLGYPKGGFLNLAKNIADASKRMGTNFYYKTKVTSIKKVNGKYRVTTNKGEFEFDVIINTLPTKVFLSIFKDIPINVPGVSGLGAVNLVLSLKNSFLTEGTYWLNVNNINMPFVSVVEHTNFMNKSNYSGETLLYVGNYLETSHKYFSYTSSELFNEYYRHLQEISPTFNKSSVNRAYLFKAQFAQPLFGLNYSTKVPPFKIGGENVYLCNMEQVYPWDRGTNYAVELGKKVADMINNEKI